MLIWHDFRVLLLQKCKFLFDMKRKILLLIVLFPVWAFSQEKVWTLEECILYAVEYNPKRQKQDAQNEIYKLNQIEVIGGFLPSINLGTSAYGNLGRGVNPETNTYVSTNTFNNSYELSSSMLLFDGFSQIYRAKMAKINRARGFDELQQIKDMIAFETMEIFFNVQYYKGIVELAKQQLEESLANLTRIQRMEELGLKSFPDVAEIRAKEAEDRFLLTKQMNFLALEIIKLKGKMNFPTNENLEIVVYENTILTSHFEENAFEVYQQALKTLPGVQIAEKMLSATEMQYKASKGQLFPRLSLSAGTSTGFSRILDDSPYMTFKDQIKNKQGSYVGVSLSIPIFNNFSRLSEVKRSKQRLVIARSEKEELLRQIYSEIEEVVADVNGLSDEYFHAKKRTGAMESAHQVNLRKYEEGLIDALELATSSNRLQNSRVEELHTNMKYQVKYQLLQYYKGKSWIYN